MPMTSIAHQHGEQLRVPERVILSPAVGVFRPAPSEAAPIEAAPDEAAPDEGTLVTEGQVVGVVEARGHDHPVRSAFTGFLMGMLAHPGERVREGQPVAWIRVS